MQGVLECPVSRTAQSLPDNWAWTGSFLWLRDTQILYSGQKKKDVISLKRVELGLMFPFVSLPKSFTYNKHSHQNSLMTSKSWLLIIYHRVLPLVSSSYTLTCKMCFLRACHILLSIQLFTGMILNEKHSYLPGNLCHTPNTILSVIT